MNVTEFDTPLDFRRDRWGRPLVSDPTTGKPVPYQRPSSWAKTIEDTFGLELWSRRNVAYGMARDTSLVARMLALPHTLTDWTGDDKKAANKVCEDAQAVAQAHKAADIGTALHRLTERADLGETVDAGPLQERLDAYRTAMDVHGVTVHPEWVECRMVCDEIGTAGTADRIVTIDGRRYIADVKTGADLTYAGLGYATQLALYAHSRLYDLATDQRIATPEVDLERGVIIHLPANGGPCRLHWIDIAHGWALAQLVGTVKAAQKRKDWLSEIAAPAVTLPVVEQQAVGDHGTAPTADDVKARLAELEPALAERVRAELKAKGITTRHPAAALALLEEVVAFETVTAEAVTTLPAKTRSRKPAEPRPPDEGGDVAEADLTALTARYEALDAGAQEWIGSLVRQARDAKVPFAVSMRSSMRRFEIARGLMLLADDGGDDVVRALVHLVTGTDAVLFANVTPGAAVGSLSAAEAVTFARHCEAFTAGRLAAVVGDDGALRLTAA